MFMIQTFMVLKGETILRMYKTSEGIEGVYKSLEFEKIKGDKIIQVSNEHEGKRNHSIREYDADGKKYEEEKLILDGIIPVPKDKKVVKGKILNKTKKEIMKETFTPAQIKEIKREELIQAEMRNMAIAKLKKEGKIK